MARAARIPLIAALLLMIVTLGACAHEAASPSGGATATETGSAGNVGATVTLGASAFGQASVTISAGQAVRFVDPGNGGGTHRLCLGSGGVCDAAAQDPSELLAPGLSLAAGSTHEITFLHAGSYAVTCTIHPSMQLTISVRGTGA